MDVPFDVVQDAQIHYETARWIGAAIIMAFFLIATNGA